MRKIVVTMLAVSIFSGGCAHWGEKEKTLGAVAIGAATGVLVSVAAGSSNKEIDQEKAIPTNALIGAAAGGLYSLFFMKDESAQKRAAMEEKLIKEASIKTESALLNDGSFPAVKNGCTDSDAFYFCSSDDPRSTSDCKNIGTIYLNKHTAVKYKVWYSPGGCFEAPTRYSIIPELENYFDKIRKQP